MIPTEYSKYFEPIVGGIYYYWDFKLRRKVRVLYENSYVNQVYRCYDIKNSTFKYYYIKDLIPHDSATQAKMLFLIQILNDSHLNSILLRYKHLERFNRK